MHHAWAGGDTHGWSHLACGLPLTRTRVLETTGLASVLLRRKQILGPL
jgi:hypothetical protein